jgi:hypothetical protein
VRCLADDIRVLLERRLEHNRSPVVQLEGFGHGSRIRRAWPGGRGMAE